MISSPHLIQEGLIHIANNFFVVRVLCRNSGRKLVDAKIRSNSPGRMRQQCMHYLNLRCIRPGHDLCSPINGINLRQCSDSKLILEFVCDSTKTTPGSFDRWNILAQYRGKNTLPVHESRVTDERSETACVERHRCSGFSPTHRVWTQARHRLNSAN